MFLSNVYKDCLRTKSIDKYVFMILDLLRAQVKKDKGNKKILVSYFAILFNKLHEFENNLIETDEFIYYYKKNAQILKIVGYIRKNYKTADLKSVAQNIHVHANYLCSLVKSITGKTFSEMLNGIKMQAAKHMLESTDDSIESISAAVGYDNPSYFYKTFKKFFDVTPGEYRESGDRKKSPAAHTRCLYSTSHNDISYLMSQKLLYSRDENPRIAFMPMGTELNYYMISIGNGLVGGLHNKSVDIFTAAPKSTADNKKQNEILKDVIEQKPHGIIICSHDLQAAAPLFKKAIETGIVICLINHDNANLPIPVHAVVGYRQKEATRRMGAYIADKMGTSLIRAGIIRGVHGYHSAQRFSGFLEPLIDKEDFDITSIQYGQWNEQGGFKAALEMLRAHPKINLIFAENDHQAVGAIRAAKQLGHQGIKIVGHDGAVSGLRHIVSGNLFATTDTHPVEMGNMAIMSVLNCLEGNITGGFIETPTDIVDKRNVVTALINH
jgi:ribose transport system substrate-binding protein